MFVAKLTVVLLLIGSLYANRKVTFEDYQVFSVDVKNQQQLDALRELEDSGEDGINFWQSPTTIGQKSDIMVAPDTLEKFTEIIQQLGLERRVMVDDVQKLIDNEQPSTRASGLEWTSYHPLEAIYEWLDEQLLAYPNILTGYEVGQSYENRTIRAVRLSHKEGNPIVFIESNIHAREWITSATATWWLNQLLTSTNPEIQDLAQNIDWVIVPVFNVDGFVYTHTTNRMWRKSRYPHGTICYGADINRNFNISWNTIGASSNICDETFAGPNALSEPETRALADFISSFSGQIDLYLCFHSYGQYFMFPNGYTTDPVENYDVLMAVAIKAQEAFAARYGTAYRIGSSSTTLYYTSGSSRDWVYATQNISLVYTIEYRDTGRYGFILPPDQIIPNAEETQDAMIAIVKEARLQNAF